MPAPRLLLAPLLLAPFSAAVAAAQGTAADYARAESYRSRVEGLVVDAPDAPQWSGDTLFTYRKTARGGGFTWVRVDVPSLAKRAPFDHARLASALAAATGRPVTPTTLPFTRFLYAEQGRAIGFVLPPRPGEAAGAEPERWTCTLADYACRRLPANEGGQGRRSFGGGLFGTPPAPDPRPRVSPDSAWEATVRDFNVHVRRRGTTAWTRLSSDGVEGDAYDARSLAWSPDSRKVAAYRVRPGFQREVHYVESSPEDQLQPRHSTLLYNKPGDVLDRQRPAIFDVAARTQLVPSDSLFPNAYAVTPLEWRADSRAVTFEYNQRGHQVYRVVELDARTGAARAVVDEVSPTFFEYSAKRYRMDLADGREVLWMSERDGWNHLWLLDGATGKAKRQVTKGAWLVRGVDWVDTARRVVAFSASGMHAGRDPYFVHHYTVDLDGRNLTALTDADAMHQVTWSPGHRYYVDLFSRVDQPPVMQLRRASDRAVLMDVERADATELYALGWKPPEVFVAKGRDGTTDIWGVIIRPMRFDSTRKYPVIENIYAGPHGSFVPKTFSAQVGMQATAEVGFIVVQVDGMGTSNRSKAFHDVAWRNLGDAGFPDRILWHRAVAARYPQYDVSRVGIYGTSAGGQSAMGALLFHPEFYKAAVSAAGCHDNRMDKIWWNEQWMGEVGPHYEASSNVVNAHRLQGKLLLVVGEMDMNVDPASTLQVVNALIRANKQFDLLVIPGAGHTSGGAYGDRKRHDFFVHHLLGVEPPDRNVSVAAGAR